MSLNWDSIDTRQQKAKKDAKDLKDFLATQQEEARKRYQTLRSACLFLLGYDSLTHHGKYSHRKQQEKYSERESYRKTVFGVAVSFGA